MDLHHEEVIAMRPIVMVPLLLILTKRTIRETYVPSDADEPCMGAFTRRSYLTVDRDGTQDLFCN